MMLVVFSGWGFLDCRKFTQLPPMVHVSRVMRGVAAFKLIVRRGLQPHRSSQVCLNKAYSTTPFLDCT